MLWRSEGCSARRLLAEYAMGRDSRCPTGTRACAMAQPSSYSTMAPRWDTGLAQSGMLPVGPYNRYDSHDCAVTAYANGWGSGSYNHAGCCAQAVCPRTYLELSCACRYCSYKRRLQCAVLAGPRQLAVAETLLRLGCGAEESTLLYTPSHTTLHTKPPRNKKILDVKKRKGASV